ncbi:G-protein coupled receptor 126-like isoform X2 [Sinocyclocheilus anshuiensis]|uniref:G-protein coupled receptor 126-like isoform X2 n=1 Tax=Sinocyclocheilus anshuiensis TaxID=1608454 RepID=UPI0007B9D2AD|nr:PREDICTED: G-protein coupled receptor 126-like isoform X2 [Sinocyclocheilus anshuiensis]
MISFISGRWWRWKFPNTLAVFLLLICFSISVAQSCQSSVSCNVVLTDSQGSFTSPCYPNDYPPSQACKWTIQAPTGFIVQITFLDFELEEAHGCIYDRIIISTGTNNAKFCGLTPNGLTLNSSGNVMEVSFNSDFSIQKKGFHISYKQVAVALRNQKVTMPKSSKNVVRVSNSVSIPVLTAFTVCFEIARTAQKSTETIFTLSDASGTSILAFEKTERGMELFISGSYCSVNDLLTSSDITSSMTPICLTWTKSTGLVAVYFGGHYRAKTCAASQVYTLPSGGILQLAGKGSSSVSVDDQNLDGFIYNFRLWDYAMPYSELSALTCDVEGNVIDWDHHYWTIPGSHTQTDSTLSCSTAIATLSPGTTGCTSPGLGCPATLTVTTASIATTNMIPFNAATHALTTTLSYTSASSMPLTTTSALLTPTTSTKTTATTVSTTSSLIQSNPPPINPAAATNSPLPNRKTNEDIFYRISLVVIDEQANTPDRDAKTMISQWLNQTFQNWIYRVYVESVSLQPNTVLSRATTIRQSYMALLVYKNTTDASLAEVEIENILRRAPAIGNGLILDSVTVNLMENCQAEEFPFHYKWPESRPTVTQYVPCFPYKEQNASRTCMISQYNYTSYWALPDRGNCTNITSISVSQENAMEVAVQLADITNNELSKEEVTQVVFKVKELVNIAKINATLASTVVTIISNVMISSEAAQKDASETALKAVDELVQKIEFDGPSLAITSKYLAVGVSALNISNFNGTTFSAFIATNLTDPQIDFESEAQNALAVVTLPPTLLHNLSYSQMERVSRINFMFFSKTGLFQDRQSNGMSLNSYVVASSVGNFTIKNLQDPVKIEIAHLEYQRDPKRLCVFWDFSLQSEDRIGGWNSEGCEVSPESNSNRTICLCNHLTHFGILMDISGASAQIDEKNNRVLTFITYIGCGISAIFSAATLLTYIAFEKLRRDYPSKILMNLSTSLLFLNMVFLLDGWLASYDIEGLCVTVAVFLHFFLLTSFTWMGLESIHMYIALVKVFNTYIRRYILKFCLVGWGVPASIVGIVLAVGKNSYGKNYYGKGENGQGTEFCWIHSPVVFYVTCVGYFSMIFLMNVAMFIVVMIQICGRNGKRSNRTLQEEILRNLRSVVSLTFLLGMTWGFAFFAWGPVSLAFMYLFSIFNSLQGLFIFVFHCALKENVQKQWRRYICCGKFRLADNSDWSKTATNNTKKVSSDNLGKSLSSSSFGSTTANWTSKAKATLNPFARHSNAGKSFSNQSSPKCSPSDGEASSSILPVHQVLDKVKGYCSVRSDNFYKNIIMSDSFSNSTKF